MFQHNYKPIGNISVNKQKENVAALLAQLMTEKNIGPGAEANKLIVEKIVEQEARKKLISDTPKFPNLKDKIQRERRKGPIKNEQPSVLAPRKVKPWNLSTATKKLSLSDKEDYGETAVRRILRIKQKPTGKVSNSTLNILERLGI